jgi:hypothetical protein
MEVSLCIQKMYFQNTIVEQEHLYPQSILLVTFPMKAC